MTIMAELLTNVPLFRALDAQERASLATMLATRTLAQGERFFDYGDPGDSLYIVSTGMVEIFLTDDTGQQITLEKSGPGDFFGEIALLTPGPRSATAVALTDVEALQIDRATLERFLLDHPTAALDFVDVLGQRLRHSNEQLRHTASRNVNEQMADTRTTLQRITDVVADFSGSIAFLVIHVIIFGAWLLFNSTSSAFDPYPFQLLTLAVSLEAIFLSTFVLISQNRQAAKDHLRSDIEYDVNLKAELEVAELHRKVDHLHAHLTNRLDQLERHLTNNSPQ